MSDLKVEVRGGYYHRIRGGIVRVMAVVEGYVLARNKGCMPFVLSVGDFMKEYAHSSESETNA